MLRQLPASPWKSILMVAERNIVAGGLLRFQRMNRALKPFGISITMAFDDLSGPYKPVGMEVIGINATLERQWDATILPGAGFSGRFMSELGRFHHQRYGTRVQAVLNDRTLLERFLQANRQFAPHSVVFNTRDWVPGSYGEFNADRFAIVEGAVDAAHFAPPIGQPNRPRAEGDAQFVVGLQSKYLDSLETLASYLPPSVVFRVIRDVSSNVLSPGLSDLMRQGRLHFLGTLDEHYLPAFYHSCDCILHLELFAGWANVVAEAMACGVPVVCSKAGTGGLTAGGATALVVDAADPVAVARAILSVQADPEAALSRCRNARAHVLRYDWPSYAARFLTATCSPECLIS